MEGDIPSTPPSTPSDDIVQARDVTPDVDDRPLEDAKSRECRFHKHLDTMFGDITFREVLKVIKKALKKRFKRVHDSVVVGGDFVPADLEGSSLNIEYARLTEMAEFEICCNRRIIVRHTIGISAPGGLEIVEVDIPYYSTITLCSTWKLRAVSILCYQASRYRLAVRGSD